MEDAAGSNGSVSPCGRLMRSLMIQDPVCRCSLLGAAIGMVAGLLDIGCDYIRYGIDEKIGAIGVLLQYGVGAPMEVGLLALVGMGIGSIVGLALAAKG